MQSVPTPNQVARAVALSARYRRQIATAQADSERRRNARRNGYSGPLTRHELSRQTNTAGR